MRAPLAALFREGACGVFAEQEGDWVEQGCALGQYVCAAFADSGAPDQPDRARSGRQDRAAGSRRHYRGAALVHADARGGEAARASGD